MILKLEKRGCNFWKDEPIQSDINNYRVVTVERIESKNGNFYFLEFCLWRNKGHYRTKTKNNKRELKRPVFEIDLKNGLLINTEYETQAGAFRDCNLEKNLNKKNYTYTKKDILKAVNSFSKLKYTTIEFI